MDVRNFVKAVASLFGNDPHEQRQGRNHLRRSDSRPRNSVRRHLASVVPDRENPDRAGQEIADDSAKDEPVKDEPVRDENTRFDDALSLLVKGRQSLLAGSLEIIGLDDVRTALGERWTLFKDVVIRLTQAELRRSLGPSDTFRKHGDASFLIHFGRLDKGAAEERARHVANQVRTSLIKTIPEFAQSISVRPFVAVIDPDEIDRSETGLADALFARLARMRSDVVADLQRRRRSLNQHTTVLFAPVWSVKKELALLHHCRANTQRSSQISALWQELVDPEEAASIVAEIDYLVFAKSLETLHRLRRHSRAALLLIPVDLRTVLSGATRREYIRLLGALPSSYRKYIMLEVCRVGADVRTSEIYDVIKKLEPHIKGVVVQLPLDDKRVTEIAASGVWGLSTSLADVDVLDRSSADPLQRFATADGVDGVKTIACGANSIGLTAAALNAGFAFVEGSAIGPAAKEPRLEFRLRTQSLALAHVRSY